jgi:hypothetical protein
MAHNYLQNGNEFFSESNVGVGADLAGLGIDIAPPTECSSAHDRAADYAITVQAPCHHQWRSLRDGQLLHERMRAMPELVTCSRDRIALASH